MLFRFHGLNVVFVCVLARQGVLTLCQRIQASKRHRALHSYPSAKVFCQKDTGRYTRTQVPKCSVKKTQGATLVPKCQSVLSKRHRALHSYPSAKVFCQKDTGRYTRTQVPKCSVKMAELTSDWNSQSGVNKVTHSRLWQWFVSVSN